MSRPVRTIFSAPLLALLLAAGPVKAQEASFVQRTGPDNPFDGFTVGANNVPAFADIDDDGDLDLFAGAGGINTQNSGQVLFFENTGTAQAPAFVQRTGDDNPLNVNVGKEAAPTFVDIDDDGDLDAFVGEGGVTIESGTVNFFENIGTAQTPAFVQRTGTDNPLALVQIGEEGEGDATPAFVDLDADGDPDVFIGEQFGTILYFENTGTAQEASFVQRTGTDNPLDGVDVGDQSNPAFADLDADGDPDALLGGLIFVLDYYENTAVALPVELTAFTARLDRGGAVIAWTTASEEQNAGFALLHRSPSEEAFRQVVFVAGAGQSTEPLTYQHRLADLRPGTHRFQLRQHDFDGRTRRSEVVTLTVPSETPLLVASPFPNPATASADVVLTQARRGPVVVRLVDALGREQAVLFEGEADANVPVRLRIDTAHLAPGLYLIDVRTRTARATRLLTRAQ